MKKSIQKYVEELEEIIEKKKFEKDLDKDVLTWISFYQHERLIHLIVTFFTGISTILFLLGFLSFESIPLLVLFFLTFCLFVPYIFHYYYLENNIQKLYNFYFIIKKSNFRD